MAQIRDCATTPSGQSGEERDGRSSTGKSALITGGEVHWRATAGLRARGAREPSPIDAGGRGRDCRAGQCRGRTSDRLSATCQRRGCPGNHEAVVGTDGRLDRAFNNAGIAGWKVDAGGKRPPSGQRRHSTA